MKIETLMKDAEKIDPQNADIFLLKAQVALGRHHFKDANSEIRKAIAIIPNRALYYGTLGDNTDRARRVYRRGGIIPKIGILYSSRYSQESLSQSHYIGS